MSVLLPEGVISLVDAPHPIHDAIVAALGLLKYEELPLDERPPKRIWFNGEAMEEWSLMVERKRKAKYEGKGEPVETGDENDAADHLLVG